MPYAEIFEAQNKIKDIIDTAYKDAFATNIKSATDYAVKLAEGFAKYIKEAPMGDIKIYFDKDLATKSQAYQRQVALSLAPSGVRLAIINALDEGHTGAVYLESYDIDKSGYRIIRVIEPATDEESAAPAEPPAT